MKSLWWNDIVKVRYVGYDKMLSLIYVAGCGWFWEAVVLIITVCGWSATLSPDLNGGRNLIGATKKNMEWPGFFPKPWF